MKPNFSKGLVPVIIQDNNTLQVLMLGYMNEDAYELTIQQQRVTFFSRSKEDMTTKELVKLLQANMDKVLAYCEKNPKECE